MVQADLQRYGGEVKWRRELLEALQQQQEVTPEEQEMLNHYGDGEFPVVVLRLLLCRCTCCDAIACEHLNVYLQQQHHPQQHYLCHGCTSAHTPPVLLLHVEEVCKS